MSRWKVFVALMGLGLMTVAACGGDGDTTTTESLNVQTTVIPTTPSEPSTATSAGAVPTEAASVTVADVVRRTGLELECDRSGPVAAGDFFSCAGVVDADDPTGLIPGYLFAVLDDVGTAAWSYGTDLPTDTTGLDRLIRSSTQGLFCRDLVDPERSDDAGMFSAVGTTESFGYFLSVVYWFIGGRPDRMDADGDGIPCETVHDAEVVAALWRGGPVG